MVSHFYFPRAEQFESRLLLAADLMPVLQSEHVEPIPAEMDTVSASDTYVSNMMLYTEREYDTTMLVVQFMDTHGPRTLHLRGDSVTTNENGYGRLPLPADVPTIDLSIRELMTGKVFVVRLELANDGQILNQTSLPMSSSNDPDSHQDMVISPGHSSSHALTATSSVFSNTDDWIHDVSSQPSHDESPAGSHADSGTGHASGMSMSSGNVSHLTTPHGYSSRPHTTGREESSDRLRDAEAMAAGHSAQEGTAMAATAPPSAQQVVEVPVDEDLEVILANWTSDQTNAVTPSFSGGLTRPVFAESPSTPVTPPTNPPPAVVLVGHVSGEETAAASDVFTDNHWPIVGGVLVAAAAAGSAAALHRRAEQLRIEAAEKSTSPRGEGNSSGDPVSVSGAPLQTA